MHTPKIAVIGSINMDLVTTAPRFPAVGETLLGSGFAQFMGGKGANQAVAAARLGAEVALVGAVGDDVFGRELLAGLQAQGVDTAAVKTLADTPTGMANITVAEADNHIIVVSGANFGLTVADIAAQEALIAAADVVLSQLEIPLPCVEAAAALAQKHGKPFILNPAPAQRLPENLLAQTSLLTPNAHELAISLGLPEHTAAQDLFAAANHRVVMTCGADGALYHDTQTGLCQQPGFSVQAVDSTGAGDTFNAALAVYWPLGLPQAVRHAAAAAALSVTRMGAQGGMPDAAALAAFLAGQP